MATGKSGDVAQPSKVAFGFDAGGAQSLAAGTLTHVPADPDSDEFAHVVPSAGVSDNSNVCGAAEDEDERDGFGLGPGELPMVTV